MSSVYKKILFTHDGSTLAASAIPHAIGIAQAFGAELILLRIIDFSYQIIPAVASTPAAIGTLEILKDISKREKHAAKNDLDKIQKLFVEAGIPKVTIVIEEGDSRDEIINAAKKYACDLIIMSTHGRSGLKRTLLGSVAEDVVRNAPCPVLLIHPTHK